MTSGTSPSQGSPQVLTTTGFDEVDTPQMRRFQRRVTLLSAGGTFLDGFDLTVIAVALPLIKDECTSPRCSSRSSCRRPWSVR